MTRSRNGGAGSSQLRIIAGQWRGRKLRFGAAPGLRPTTDRIRETLFNWLAPHLGGARCADLFAGSGALGLEALSRGARHCDFVDTSRAAIQRITAHLVALQATGRGRCHTGDALRFLQGSDAAYDLVFVDPPFGRNLVQPCCTQLATPGRLAQQGLVYVESAAADPPPEVPANWSLHRDKRAGGVAYRLYRAL